MVCHAFHGIASMGEIGEYKFPNALVVSKRGLKYGSFLLVRGGWCYVAVYLTFVCNLLLDCNLLCASAHNY